MSIKILLDMDGVIANFIAGTCRLHGVGNPYDNPEAHGRYDVESLLGVRGVAFSGRMGRSFWATLPKMPDADAIVTLLEKKFGAANICILTSPMGTDGCVDGKLAWIRKYYPQYRRQFLVGPAKEFCAHQNSLLIDDYERNIARFKDAGGQAFLVPALWNHDYDLHPLTTLIDFLKGY